MSYILFWSFSGCASVSGVFISLSYDDAVDTDSIFTLLTFTILLLAFEMYLAFDYNEDVQWDKLALKGVIQFEDFPVHQHILHMKPILAI